MTELNDRYELAPGASNAPRSRTVKEIAAIVVDGHVSARIRELELVDQLQQDAIRAIKGTLDNLKTVHPTPYKSGFGDALGYVLFDLFKVER